MYWKFDMEFLSIYIFCYSHISGNYCTLYLTLLYRITLSFSFKNAWSIYNISNSKRWFGTGVLSECFALCHRSLKRHSDEDWNEKNLWAHSWAVTPGIFDLIHFLFWAVTPKKDMTMQVHFLTLSQWSSPRHHL